MPNYPDITLPDKDFNSLPEITISQWKEQNPHRCALIVINQNDNTKAKIIVETLKTDEPEAFREACQMFCGKTFSII